jgi:hypothetical protein
MSNIVLPGFTARTSVYETGEEASGHHGGQQRKDNRDSLVPQRMKLVEVHCECDTWTDICVCDNGRVLHATLGEL